jgi:hypothetical protein
LRSRRRRERRRLAREKGGEGKEAREGVCKTEGLEWRGGRPSLNEEEWSKKSGRQQRFVYDQRAVKQGRKWQASSCESEAQLLCPSLPKRRALATHEKLEDVVYSTDCCWSVSFLGVGEAMVELSTGDERAEGGGERREGGVTVRRRSRRWNALGVSPAKESNSRAAMPYDRHLSQTAHIVYKFWQTHRRCRYMGGKIHRVTLSRSTLLPSKVFACASSPNHLLFRPDLQRGDISVPTLLSCSWRSALGAEFVQIG